MKFGYLWQTSLSKNRPIDADNYNKYDDGINILPHVLPAFFNKIGFFVGLALKKLKLCCHFLSWKSSERRNNLSYISVTYPGSAG